MALFNPHATVEVVRFDERNFCLVIDDALLEPEQQLQYAATHRQEFRPVDFNAYPGTYLKAPAALIRELCDLFLRSVRRYFNARRGVDVHCRFSMVTLAPRALSPIQWLCHRDDVRVPANLSMQASVLYLYHDPRLGGTSFYAPARPAAETDALFNDARRLAPDAFTRKYGIGHGFMRKTNEYFHLLGNIPARWNRLIFYDGGMLHSGEISAPELLSEDPLAGRLTLNGFFTSTRNLA
jgi:uncharacterized protein DUF6445